MDLVQVTKYLGALDHLIQGAGQELRKLEQAVYAINEQNSSTIAQPDEQKPNAFQMLEQDLIQIHLQLKSASMSTKEVLETQRIIREDLAEIRRMIEADVLEDKAGDGAADTAYEVCNGSLECN